MAAKKKAKKPAGKVKKPAKMMAKSTKKLAAAKTPTRAAFLKGLTPLDDRLLVRIEGASEKTAGGLYIPATVSERPQRGQVIASGRGHRNKKGKIRPLDVKVGDTVLYPKYSGTTLELGGEEFLILREDEVLAVEERK